MATTPVDALESLLEADLFEAMKKDPDGVFKKRLSNALLEYEGLLKAEINKGLSGQEFSVKQELLGVIKASNGFIEDFWARYNQR